jgi:hypothetical protein
MRDLKGGHSWYGLRPGDGNMRVRHRSIRLVAVAALLVVLGGVARAHDFWLVPNAFRLGEGADLTVRGQTSSKFPTSESAVAPDRVSEARVIGATSDVKIADVNISGSSLMLRSRPGGRGQHVVAVSIAPRSLRASGPGFKRYMELEGAAALAARYEAEGILPKTDSITRRYAKYAKTIVEVGAGGPRAFSRVAGHPAEFVPLDDPASARAGDTLRVRLMFRGAPLTNFHVEAGYAVEGKDPVDASLETDASGVARIHLTKPGLWNIRTLHIVPADSASGADWDSHFVTLVFEVGPARR